MEIKSTQPSRKKLFWWIAGMLILVTFLFDWLIYLNPAISPEKIIQYFALMAGTSKELNPSICDTILISVQNFLKPTFSIVLILAIVIGLKFLFSLFNKFINLFFEE